MYPLSLKTRITRLLLEGHTVLSIVLSILASLLFSGFLLSSHLNANPNYRFLVQLFNYDTWASLFAAYGLIKLAGCLYRVPNFIKALNSNLGLWIWIFIYLSFVIFDTTAMTPLENMLLLPIFCEVWALTIIFYCPKHRRATDVCNHSTPIM